MTARLGLALALVTLLVMPASAQVTPTVILDDNFDSYADQAAFEAVWTPAGAQPSTTLSTAQAVSAPNSVRVAPERDSTQVPPGSNLNAQRSERSFEETMEPSVDNIIRYSFDFYDSIGTGNPRRHYANLQDGQVPTASGQLIAMGMNNNQLASANGGNYYMARVLGYNPSIDGETGGAAGSFFKLNGTMTADPASVPQRSLGWHNLAVDISDTEFKFYVDGFHARTVLNTFTPRSYDYIRLGAGLTNTDTESFFDNVQVILNAPPIVPPPTDDADFDGDGDVDGQDFLTWQQNLGISDGSAELADGDADDNGNVEGADLGIWQDQFVPSPPAVAAASAIPEPASIALAAVALLAGLAITRRS